MSTDIEPTDPRLAEIRAAGGDVGFAIEAAKGFEVTSESDVEIAAELLAQVNAASKAIEAKRTELTGPLNKVIRALNEAAKEAQGELPATSKALRDAISAYKTRVAQEREAAAAAERERTGDAVIDPGALPAPAPQRIATSSGNVSTRKRWTFEVTDERAFLVACTKTKKAWEEHGDMAMVATSYLNDATKNGLREFPGVRIFQKEDAVVR